MEINVKTKFNVGDEVTGTIISNNNKEKLYKTAHIEGFIKKIIVTYVEFGCNEKVDKRLGVSYEVQNGLGIIFNCNEENLKAVKRTLDYFSTDELEEEIKRRKEKHI